MSTSPKEPLIEEELKSEFDTNCAKYQGGLKRTIDYIKLWENHYRVSIGAHFLRNLHEQGNDTLTSFSVRFAKENHGITLTELEQECLDKAAEDTDMLRGFSATGMMENVKYNTMTRRTLLNLGIDGAAGLALAILSLKDPLTYVIKDQFDLPFLSTKEEALCADIFLEAGEAIEALPEAERTDAMVKALFEERMCLKRIEYKKRSPFESEDKEIDWLKVARNTAFAASAGFFGAMILRGTVKHIKESMNDSNNKAEKRVTDMDAFCNERIGRTGTGLNTQLNKKILEQNKELATQNKTLAELLMEAVEQNHQAIETQGKQVASANKYQNQRVRQMIDERLEEVTGLVDAVDRFDTLMAKESHPSPAEQARANKPRKIEPDNKVKASRLNGSVTRKQLFGRGMGEQPNGS